MYRSETDLSLLCVRAKSRSCVQFALLFCLKVTLLDGMNKVCSRQRWNDSCNLWIKICFLKNEYPTYTMHIPSIGYFSPCGVSTKRLLFRCKHVQMRYISKSSCLNVCLLNCYSFFLNQYQQKPTVNLKS